MTTTPVYTNVLTVPNTAGVAYLGYNAPDGYREAISGNASDDWQEPFGGYVTNLAAQYPNADITVVALSHGSVVAGRSKQYGFMNGPNIRMVMLGSPGWSRGDENLERNLSSGIFVANIAGYDDPVPVLPWHGDTVAHETYIVDGGHSDYWKGESLDLIGALIQGEVP